MRQQRHIVNHNPQPLKLTVSDIIKFDGIIYKILGTEEFFEKSFNYICQRYGTKETQNFNAITIDKEHQFPTIQDLTKCWRKMIVKYGLVETFNMVETDLQTEFMKTLSIPQIAKIRIKEE